MNLIWVPSIPLPLMGVFRKQCVCGHKFFRTQSYRDHYVLTHFGSDDEYLAVAIAVDLDNLPSD